jgi:hypothetical protein
VTKITDGLLKKSHTGPMKPASDHQSGTETQAVHQFIDPMKVLWIGIALAILLDIAAVIWTYVKWF